MFSIEVENYAAWYKLAGEFFKNAEGASAEELEMAGKKLLEAIVAGG